METSSHLNFRTGHHYPAAPSRPDLTAAVIGIVMICSVFSTLPAAAASGAECRGHPATITGTAGNDTLVGTPGPDVIVGLQGNDKIYGKGGGDVICGSRGQDRLRGGAGGDSLSGGAGSDSEFGGKGGDTLRSSGAYDTFFGDYMHGGRGDDRLIGDSGGERLWPGPGDDYVDGVSGASDMLLYVHAAYGVHVNLARREATGQGHDSLRNITDVIGSSHNDNLVGSGNNNFLAGGALPRTGSPRLGSDTLRGGKGKDQLVNGFCINNRTGCSKEAHGLGNDRLHGGGGVDVLFLTGKRNLAAGGRNGDQFYFNRGGAQLQGGAGKDVFELARGYARIFGGHGIDLLRFLGPLAPSGYRRLPPPGPAKVDVSAGTASAPHLTATLKDVEKVRGTTGKDVLKGDSGRNVLRGQGDNDRLRGRAGNDYLDGGNDIDVLHGGTGTDRCVNGEDLSGCER